MSLQNVLNNLSSAAGSLFEIFGIICLNFNSFKLKFDFIEENILFQMDKEAIKENKDISFNPQQNDQFIEIPTILNPQQNEQFIEPLTILNLQQNQQLFEPPSILNRQHNHLLMEHPIIYNPNQSSRELDKKITKTNLRPFKTIKMKSFFDLVLCSKNEDTIKIKCTQMQLLNFKNN